MSASNIQVAIKVRPIDPNQANQWKVAGNSIKLVAGGGPEPFYFDHIFDQDASNQVIFDTIAKQIVASGVKGFNGTIFAYGQTSSGKTYTMMGDEQNPGVMVLAAKKIFTEIENSTDWQFLLRVSYIEIYNEKIHDLLNKSNTDLKIHETSNGEVAVNCSENIITCEQDLLMYLREGSKQRKIGETHMNDRSSRSHAIFRIIIESRKMDTTDEDSVQISILNLVDLAGSERADQTGATGSRLKEGSHINKSLLVLSRVIKQLAEAKYVSYRDSKLTRILQASLGGNALTAIICTINPTAVEETLSTLSFANRAKVVKNKPQVNEVVSDTAMMKRLVKKIDALTTELEVEKTKNSQIKVTQLTKLLNDEIHKIINSNSLSSLKAANRNRRRTWCPSSMIPTLAEETPAKTKTETSASVQPLPSISIQAPAPTKMQLPKSCFNFTPHITVRDVYYQEKLKEIESSPNIDEEFIPGEIVCFDDLLTPQTSPKLVFKTPTNENFPLRASLTPKLTEKQSLQKVEQELKELETFTNLENKLNVEHDPYSTLKHKLENAERIIAGFQKEREEFAFIKVEHLEAQTNLDICQKRCQELESKVKDLEDSSQISLDRINRYENEVTDLKAKINQLEMENRTAVGLEFEFEQHKSKSKRREAELLEAISEKNKEINKLERSLQTVTNEMLNNSKEEIQQISKSLNETESSCTNCKDFQRLLTSKQQLIEEYEKANIENKELHESIKKISIEAESAKLRADYLETENTSLKKDNENFASRHGTLESLQKEIDSLQSEKSKLETLKKDLELLSTETANKLAEKTNITQEIETLTTQKENLVVECEKLQAEITSVGCTKDELKKIRAENDSLNSELQKIKNKLETTEQEQTKLLAENQSMSDSFQKLNMEVIGVRNHLQTLQSEYTDIQTKYEQIQVECNKHEGTIGEIQSEYDSIQSKYQQLQKEYEKLENDSVQSSADCDRVQTQNENLETEIRDLKAKVEEAQRKLLENDSLQLELESLKSEMNRLQGEGQNSLQSNEVLKEEELRDLKSANSKLKGDLSSLQLRFDELQKEYDETSSQLMENIEDQDALQMEMKNLQEELDRYKNAVNPADLPEAMKNAFEKLEADNNELHRKNSELTGTLMSLKEKCSHQNGSANNSPDNSIQFCDIAKSFLEIEIALGNGTSRIFKSVEFDAFPNANTKFIIENISEIKQGEFGSELHGSIEFAISNETVVKLCNEMFDSLEMDKQATTSPSSCDSLEVPRINVNQLNETVSRLKSENIELTNTRKELEDQQAMVEQLKCEKSDLSATCEDKQSQIRELSEIISRVESENLKLIADCEKLKKAVEFEGSLESFEEGKRQQDEINKKVQMGGDCEACSELRLQVSALKAKLVSCETTNVNRCSPLKESKCTSCEDNVHRNSVLQTPTKLEYSNGDGRAEVNGNVELSTSQTENNKSANYEDEICRLKELNQESSKQIEDLSIRCKKLQNEYDELLSFERMKSTELEATIVRLDEFKMECSLLQEIIKTVEDERNTILQEKKFFEDVNNNLSEQLKVLKEDNLSEKETSSKETAMQSEEQNETDKEELLKLKADFEEIEREKRFLEEKLNKFGDELERVSSEKHDLQRQLEKLKDEHEVLKENETEERQILQEKSESLCQQIKELTSNKVELELALENFKTESEIVRQRSKNAEEQLNLRISELQDQLSNVEEIKSEKVELTSKCASLIDKVTELENSCATMKQELTDSIETLKIEESLKQRFENECSKLNEKCLHLEKQLSDAKHQLEMSQNEFSEKDKSISDLTSRNQILVTENTQLEDKISSLQQELEKLNQELSEDLRLKIEDSSKKDDVISEISSRNTALTQKTSELEEKLCALQKDFEQMSEDFKLRSEELSKKDIFIAELSLENKSLASKSSDDDDKQSLLQKQLEESKRCNEVLEQANTERDNLIVNLTNNNNSLVNKNSELEEKLAILRNQFDESTRHFSAEVSRLQKSLSEHNAISTEQASKIDEMMQKFKFFEGQVETAQKTTLERDTLLQRMDVLQKDYDSLALKNVNLELQKSTFEAELNSARAVVVENTNLSKQVNELQSSLNEIQLKCSALSSNSTELELANKKLVMELKDAVQQAEECNRLRSEILTLRQEVEKEQTEKNALSMELKDNLKTWESKEILFSNQISQLQVDMSVLTSEKSNLQKEYEETVKNFSTKVAQLEQQVQLLQKEGSLNTSKSSISPKKEKAKCMEHWLSDNHTVKIKNMSLMDKLDSCQKSTPNEERKNRRLSTHDERRFQSFWDTNRDVSTMTEPTNAECSCLEMNKKLNELKQLLLIRDSQVNTLNMELKNHPLKAEYATLKKLYVESESQHQELRKEIKKLKSQRTNDIRHCTKCSELAKKVFVESFTQTTETDDSEMHSKLTTKYQQLKLICQNRLVKIRELETALSKGKENANNDNISSMHNQHDKQKYEQLKKELIALQKEHNLLQKKYEEVKTLCIHRFEKIKALEQQGNS